MSSRSRPFVLVGVEGVEGEGGEVQVGAACAPLLYKCFFLILTLS